MTQEGGSAMFSSISHLITSADTDILRLIRAAKNLTQTDIVARAEDSILPGYMMGA
jgi:hypothetical protein